MAINTISAASLNRLVTLLEPTQSRGLGGQSVMTYATATSISPAVRHARIRQMTGVEEVRAGALVFSSPFEITMRYTAGLTTDYQLATDDSDTLEILSVEHRERHDATVCMCRRATSG